MRARPSELLRRRPDIRRAERQLAASLAKRPEIEYVVLADGRLRCVDASEVVKRLHPDERDAFFDPATGNPDGTGRTPFPNNQIPASRFSPFVRNLLANEALYPRANVSRPLSDFRNNYRGTAAELAAFYAACDVFVSASEIGEAQGMANLEAMTFGVRPAGTPPATFSDFNFS